MNNEAMVKELLVSALRDLRDYYCVINIEDLIRERLYFHIEMTDELYYLENDEDNIDLIAESRDLTTKDMLALGVSNNYDPRKHFVNSNLETVSTSELADIYIDNIERIWALFSEEDKKEIADELTESTRDIDEISYYIVGPEDEIESLISMANDIAINRISVDYEEAINEEVNGAEIIYEAGDGCLTVLKDTGDKDNLMKVRKEVSNYATWIKYYYPNGEEELVYHKAK